MALSLGEAGNLALIPAAFYFFALDVNSAKP